MRSGPSSTGSVITFDPDALRSRVTSSRLAWASPGSGTTSRGRRDLLRARTHEQAARALRHADPRVRGRARAARARRRHGRRDRVGLQPLRAELARLQEAALFSGEYDQGDAILSIHTATGGIDAQDFTEMLLRMYLLGRAARLQDGAPGGLTREEAGLKSATLTVSGENAYGILKAERASTGSSALALRPGAPAPHLLLAGRGGAAASGRRRDRDRRGRPADRHLPRLRAPAAST